MKATTDLADVVAEQARTILRLKRELEEVREKAGELLDLWDQFRGDFWVRFPRTFQGIDDAATALLAALALPPAPSHGESRPAESR